MMIRNDLSLSVDKEILLNGICFSLTNEQSSNNVYTSVQKYHLKTTAETLKKKTKKVKKKSGCHVTNSSFHKE